MYSQIREEISAKIKEIDKQIKELQKEQKAYSDVIIAIREMQAVEDKRAGRLAVQKGICPFPNCCNQRNYCTKDSCNADVCDNGYCYRQS